MAPFLAVFQPILVFDAAQLHLADEVLAELNNLRIWYVVVPALMTWLLQPLDTHGFQMYKRYLKQRFQDANAAGPTPPLSVLMIRLVCGAIRDVLQGVRWTTSFRKDGFGAQQREVSSYIRNELEFESLPDYPSEAPTAASLRFLWPRNRIANVEAVMLGMPPRPADPAPIAPQPSEAIADEAHDTPPAAEDNIYGAAPAIGAVMKAAPVAAPLNLLQLALGGHAGPAVSAEGASGISAVAIPNIASTGRPDATEAHSHRGPSEANAALRYRLKRKTADF